MILPTHVRVRLPGCRTRPQALLVAVGDASAREVVRGDLHDDLVSRQDADVIHPQLSGNVRQNFVPVCAAVTDSTEFHDAPVKLKGKIQNIIEILDDKIIW